MPVMQACFLNPSLDDCPSVQALWQEKILGAAFLGHILEYKVTGSWSYSILTLLLYILWRGKRLDFLVHTLVMTLRQDKTHCLSWDQIWYSSTCIPCFWRPQSAWLKVQGSSAIEMVVLVRDHFQFCWHSKHSHELPNLANWLQSHHIVVCNCMVALWASRGILTFRDPFPSFLRMCAHCLPLVKLHTYPCKCRLSKLQLTPWMPLERLIPWILFHTYCTLYRAYFKSNTEYPLVPVFGETGQKNESPDLSSPGLCTNIYHSKAKNLLQTSMSSQMNNCNRGIKVRTKWYKYVNFKTVSKKL